MSYPLPGETLIATLRRVEFGMSRPLDEPAPSVLAALFLAWRSAEDAEEQAYLAHDAARYSREHFRVWLMTQSQASKAYEALANVLKKHRHRCFVMNNYRFWWFVEHEGCRREYVKWEVIQ